MPNGASQAYAELIPRLERLRRLEARTEVMSGAAAIAAACAGLVILLLILETALYMPPRVKLAMWVAWSGGTSAGLIVLCIRPLIRRRSLESVAMDVEARHPEMRQRLVGTVELWPGREANREGYSTGLIEAMAEQARRLASRIEFESVFDRGRWRRAVLWLAGAISALLLAGLSGEVRAAGWRLWHPSVYFSRPSATGLSVSPGDATVLKGEGFEVTARLSGRMPALGTVAFREEGSEVWERVSFEVSNARGSYPFRGVRRSFEYRVLAGDAVSPTFRLRALDRPIVFAMRMTYRYPEYTGLEERTEEEGTDILAVKGTQVKVEMLANKPLRSAFIAFDNGQTVEGRVDGQAPDERSAVFELTVSEDGQYNVHLVDREGISSADELRHRIVVIPDERPAVRIVFPGRDLELGEEMLVSLQVEARDDFGFSGMEILHALNDGREEARIPLRFGKGGEVSASYLWDLSDLGLLPEDRVRYRVRVYDNDAISGFKSAETPLYMIRLPSLAEIAEEGERSQQASISALEEVVQEGKRVRERLEEMGRDLTREAERKDGKLDWERKKDVESAVTKQVELGERVRKLSEEIGRTLEKLGRHGVVNPETLKKVEEIRKLLSDVMSAELREAMKKLQEAAESLDPKQVQQALENLARNQEEFQRRLDRTIAMLKRVQREQIFDALARRADELVRAQVRVNEGLGSREREQDLADREMRIKKETEEVRDAIEKMAEEVRGEHPATADSLEAVRERVARERLTERMEGMAEGMLGGERGRAQGEGEWVYRALARLSKSLREVHQSFVAQSKAVVAGEMDQALQETLALSKRQEEINGMVNGMRGGVKGYSQAAEAQQILMSGAERLTDRMLKTAQKTFFVTPELREALGRSLGRMKEAISMLEGLNGAAAADRGREAMGGLNQAAILLRRALSDLAVAASAMGMDQVIQQMGAMAGRQSGVNKGTQQLLGAGENAVTGPGEDRLSELAAEQEAIRQALQELQDRLGGQTGMLGRLDKIGEEMGKVLQDLRKGASRRTMERQRQVLSRMLDATRSIRQQGYSDERVSEVGKDFRYAGPSSLPDDLGEGRDPLREAMLRALREGYPGEYRTIIRGYFEALAGDKARQERD